MYPQQYDQFMTTIILHFGRNLYFKRRRGDIFFPRGARDDKTNAWKGRSRLQNGLRSIWGTHQLECLSHAFTVPCQYHISVTAVSVIWYSSTSYIKLQYQLYGTKTGTGKECHTSPGRWKLQNKSSRDEPSINSWRQETFNRCTQLCATEA